MKPNQIRNLVFSSGAIGGISFVGAIRALYDKGVSLRQIHGISGCSIGSIMALLYSLNFSVDDLQLIVLKYKHKHYTDIHVIEYLERCGLESGNKIIKLVSDLIQHKIGVPDLTFEQHWILTGRDLWINASCLDLNKPCYYSVKTDPNMSILSAIRKSICIPFMLTAVRENGHTYIDGGYHDAIPAHMFDPSSTLCFRVINQQLGNIRLHMGDFVEFCMQILAGMHTTINNFRVAEVEKLYYVINIKTNVSAMSLNIKRKQRWKLIHEGYQCVYTSLRS